MQRSTALVGARRDAIRLAVGAACGLVVLAGCASGAGPDGPTDRACKELAAAAASQVVPLQVATEHGIDALSDHQTGQLRGYGTQLRVIAADASGGELADTLGALSGAAQEWDTAWAAGDVSGLQAVADLVERDLGACREADVSLPE